MFTYQASIDYILSIPLFGKKDGHNNTIELLRRLNSPQLSLKYIHVAGTNGKGSVCSMLSHIYVEEGYKVGFFSSPHLVKLNERFKINNIDIADELFTDIFNKVKDKIDDMVREGFNHPTYFETLFCMAIVYFSIQNADIVILETGLGGRLDATNCIEKPLVSVITQISLDHVNILGDTIDKVAFEKGGIIKEDCPTVLQSDEEAIINVITKICEERHSRLYEVMPIRHGILKRYNKTIDFSIDNKYYKYDKLTLNSTAFYQILNVATALTTVYVLNNTFFVHEKAIRIGLSNFYWPGRMEIINDYLILDGAHNPNGIDNFIKSIDENFKDRDITLLFSVMKDKAYDEMIMKLSSVKKIKKIVITKVNDTRCLELKEIKETFNKYIKIPIQIEEDPIKAFKMNYQANGNLLCCVGSLYLIGEVKKMIGGILDD